MTPMTVITPAPLPLENETQSSAKNIESVWGLTIRTPAWTRVLQWFVQFSQFYGEYNSRAPQERYRWLQQQHDSANGKLSRNVQRSSAP